MNPFRPTIALLLSIPFAGASAADEIEFSRAHDLIRTYCVECHNPADEKGGLDLAVLEKEADFLAEPILLEDLEWVVAEEEMPTPKAEKQPTDEERRELVAWIQQELMKIQNAMPEDPGPVVVPRLSSKEFDYVIEDLTGRDYELARFLTADTASGEGFYNVGSGQQLSVGQFESFMNVGKMLMDHARHVPGMGVWWMDGPQPPLQADEDLPEFLVEELYELVMRTILPDVVSRHAREIARKTPFSKDQTLGAYLEAAWRFRHREALGFPKADLETIAADYEPALFPSALKKVAELLARSSESQAPRKWNENNYMDWIIRRWEELPAPQSADDLTAAREPLTDMVKWLDAAGDMRNFGNRLRDFEIPPEDKPEAQQRRGYYERGEGYLPIDASKLPDRTVYLAATGRLFPGTDPLVVWGKGTVTFEDGSKRPWHEAGVEVTSPVGRPVPFGYHPSGEGEPDRIATPTPGYIEVRLPDDATSFEISGLYDPSESDTPRLLRVKPFAKAPDVEDAMAFADRTVIRKPGDKGVAAAQGMMGAVNKLAATAWPSFRPAKEDIFAHESEAVRDFVGVRAVERPEDRQNYWNNIFAIDIPTMETEMDGATADHHIRRYGKLREAIRSAADAQGRSEREALAEKRRILEDFATTAWRAAATGAEIDELMEIYRAEKQNDTPTEQALETAMRAVILSPKFLYRFTESRASEEPYPLQPRELAVRLASVLWSGLPDAELYAAADSGRLPEPKVLEAQIDRMLAHPRADRFIEEFFGRWLHFAEFDTFNGPDAEKFKEWDKGLARLMHEEATRFMRHLVREDRPLTDLFHADYTFLNQRLAEHYGIGGVKGEQMRKVRLDDPARGGILGMGAFLVKTSSPLRTSPVHRGLWLYEDVLARPVPEPPPVPLLSDDGVDEQGRGIVEQLRQHRDDPACYSCHDRFDPMGVALENFDPIGRWRTKVEGKADVESQGLFRSGETIDGIDGLRDYLGEQEDTLLEAFATKLLGYSLGRSVLPTDKNTLAAMIEAMRANDMSPRAAIHTALTSPQFLQRRDIDLASQ